MQEKKREREEKDNINLINLFASNIENSGIFGLEYPKHFYEGDRIR